MSLDINKTISEKKRYICDACLTMSKEDLVSILNFLIREHVSSSKFSQNLDGLKINLNSVPDSVVERLYNFIQYKISTS